MEKTEARATTTELARLITACSSAAAADAPGSDAILLSDSFQDNTHHPLMARFLFTFLALLLVLFALELTPPVQHAVVMPWTALLASLSAWAIGLFDQSVISYGKVLQHAGSGLGVSIEAGCNGIEASIILIAAVLAYPASWYLRAAGIVLGFLAIQVVNIGRVASLFYLADWNQAAFEFAHLYLWQIFIMVDVLVVWLIWIRQVAKREELRVAVA